MFGESVNTKMFSLSLAILLISIQFVHLADAVAGKLEVALCNQADLVSGEFKKIEELTAGANGFMIAVTSSYENSVMINLSWEALQGNDSVNSKQLSGDTVVLGVKQTKFVPFKAPEGGLISGLYHIVLSVTGQENEFLRFVVKPAPDTSGSSNSQNPHNSSKPNEENVSEALTRVFNTTEGPETAKAGIEVVSTFFDKELNTSANTVKADSKNQTDTEKLLPETNKNNFLQPIAEPVKTPQSIQGQPATVSTSGGTSPATQGELIRSSGIEIICARQVDVDKTPLDTPQIFFSSDEKIYLAMRSMDSNLKDLVTVQWLAHRVEGMPEGKKITNSREVLRVGDWNTAVFLPPYGGFFPGQYRVKVSKDGKPLAHVDFSIKSRNETALLLEEITPPNGINIAHSGLGGSIVSATSESNGTSWGKQGLIDGYGYGGEDCKPSCGWASSDRKFPQELIFSFYQDREALLDGLILDGESCSGDEKCLQSLPRLVEIWVSSQAVDSGYTLETARRLRPVAGRHFIPLQGIHAKYLKLIIKSNYGGSRRTQLAEVEILEKPGQNSIVQQASIDLALPAFGGSLLRYTSERYGGEAVRLLQKQADGKGWSSQDQKMPQEFTFCLRDDGVALIDRLELNLDSGFDPSTRPKEIVLLLSSSSPTDGFVEAARVQLPNNTDSYVIPLNRKARFIKLQILENQGGKHTSLGKVGIIEGSEPGYTSRLLMPLKPITSSSLSTPKLDPSLVTSSVQPALSLDQAPALEIGERIKALFEDYSQKHYYSLNLVGNQKGMLNLELMGVPFLRTKFTLKNQESGTLAVFHPRRNTRSKTLVSWLVEPGQYILEAESTPANLVLAWDVSRSMAAHTDLLQKAVIGFLENVQPSEKLSLIAFNNNIHVLTEEFTSDKDQLLAAVSGKFKTEMATRLYDAIEKGIKLLGDTEGIGAIVVLTDGADMGSTLKTPQFWEVLDSNPVRMFTIGLGRELKVRNPKTGLSGSHFLHHIAEAGGGRFIFIPSVEQLVNVYKQVAKELMAGTTYYLKPTWTIEPGSLLIKTEGERIAQLATPPSIELVLDGSGSMKKKLGDRTRMAIAKEVLSDLIQGLPPDVEVALRVYGHRIREGQQGDCQDTQLLYPFGKLDKDRLIGQIQTVKPLGTTPITYSLRQTARDFGDGKGEKTVILLTDGKEECGGDLEKTVDYLRDQGLDVRLHIVGFAVKDPLTQEQMQIAAEAGGGRYLNAADRLGLEKAIAQTLAIPFIVRDSGGREIAQGVAGEELSLPAGFYQIVLDTPQGELIQEEVWVGEGKITLLRVTKDGPKIGVQVLPPGATK